MSKKTVFIAALIILIICVYSFLVGNEVFQGHFRNDAVSWYILAKGIFCFFTLNLIVQISESLRNR